MRCGLGKARRMFDVLTFEQPSAAQKFSAQEFLKARRSVKKKTEQTCRPRGLLESKHIERRKHKNQQSDPRTREFRLKNAAIMREF